MKKYFGKLTELESRLASRDRKSCGERSAIGSIATQSMALSGSGLDSLQREPDKAARAEEWMGVQTWSKK